ESYEVCFDFSIQMVTRNYLKLMEGVKEEEGGSMDCSVYFIH
ncbi:hypothetical protein POVCU2_0088370, partial [Plasmodium ovale curtisi]